ncbi:hypothetical protein AB0P37_13345, partial [Streptomyces antimycoticus]|uniref:hypothetical protein n=1 Tax=Streptomyces antimycoticus TaxID=68175 RepID=UPI003435B167
HTCRTAILTSSGRPPARTQAAEHLRHSNPPENGRLHHCLQTGELFDEHIAFPSELAAAA